MRSQAAMSLVENIRVYKSITTSWISDVDLKTKLVIWTDAPCCVTAVHWSFELRSPRWRQEHITSLVQLEHGSPPSILGHNCQVHTFIILRTSNTLYTILRQPVLGGGLGCSVRHIQRVKGQTEVCVSSKFNVLSGAFVLNAIRTTTRFYARRVLRSG